MAGSESGTRKKKTIRLANVGGLFVVNPPALMVRPRTEIYVVNPTDRKVLVFMPQAQELLGKRNPWEVVEVPRGGKPKKIGTIAAQPVEFPQVFSYAVFVESDGSFAVAGSNPRIIVY